MADQLLAFTATALVVIVVPGPDMVLVLRNTARDGRAGALWSATGIMTGLAVMGTAAALGITALLTAVPTVEVVVRIAGGAYLLYLGARALLTYLRTRRTVEGPLRTAGAAIAARTEPPPGARSSCFRQGLLCNLLNPKVAAFYLALFPQFDLDPLDPLAQHVLLAAGFWTLCLLWYVLLVALIARLTPVLQSPTFARRTEGAAGVALLALGTAVFARAA